MGTPEFAVPSLERVLADGHEVLAVYTRPDRPKGRHAVLEPPPVKRAADGRGLTVRQPVRLRDGTVRDEIAALAPDCIVVVAYGRILPEEILEIPPKGCVNIHGSLLPKYRGAAPVQWSVMNGETVTGVSAQRMEIGLDTGPVYGTLETRVGADETAGELFERLAPLGAELLGETLRAIGAGTAEAVPQNEAEATTAPPLTRETGAVDFSADAAALHNRTRGLNPWPGAYCRSEGKILKIHTTKPAGGTGKPGTILSAEPLVVACGTDALELVTVQPQGGRRMPGSDWIRGARLRPGDPLQNG